MEHTLKVDIYIIERGPNALLISIEVSPRWGRIKPKMLCTICDKRYEAERLYDSGFAGIVSADHDCGWAEWDRLVVEAFVVGECDGLKHIGPYRSFLRSRSNACWVVHSRIFLRSPRKFFSAHSTFSPSAMAM